MGRVQGGWGPPPSERVKDYSGLDMWIKRLSIAVTIVVAMWGLPGRALGQSLDGRQGENQDGIAYYRTPENDAVNCLYLQLRLLGYTENYEVFREQLPADPSSMSLDSMARVGQKMGFRLVPVKISLSDLAKAGAPVIVHFEQEGIGKGQFLLFLAMTESEYAFSVIEGRYIWRTQMPRDEFRRKWTGYALIPRPRIDWELWIRRGAAALVVLGAGAWLALRVGNWYRSLMSRTRQAGLDRNQLGLRNTADSI
jgi:Peptidase C39 family